MDRARNARLARAGVGSPGDRTTPAPAIGGGALRGVRCAALAASAVVAGAACKSLSPDFGAVIAIDVSLPDSVITIGDTTRPRAVAIDARGDSTAAAIVWSSLDSTIQVVDSATGAAVGLFPGTGRLVARVGALRSNPASVTILGVLDSIVAVKHAVDTVAVSSDTLSDSLEVEAFSGGLPTGLRPIILAFTLPPGGTGFTLVPGDTVVTGSNGIALFFVRLTGARPDSAVVTASATYHGTPVLHSPIQFTVFFP